MRRKLLDAGIDFCLRPGLRTAGFLALCLGTVGLAAHLRFDGVSLINLCITGLGTFVLAAYGLGQFMRWLALRRVMRNLVH